MKLICRTARMIHYLLFIWLAISVYSQKQTVTLEVNTVLTLVCRQPSGTVMTWSLPDNQVRLLFYKA